jgi:hypothetical protein
MYYVLVVLLVVLGLLASFCLQFLVPSLAFADADHRSVGFSMLVFRRRRYRPRPRKVEVGRSVGKRRPKVNLSFDAVGSNSADWLTLFELRLTFGAEY